MNATKTISEVGEIVRETVAQHGCRLESAEITDETTISQDAKIDGIDVYDFVNELEESFGAMVWSIPWSRFSDQRASFYGCQTAIVPFWLIWRLFRWPFDGFWLPLPNGGEEQLTVGHLTNVFFRQEWFEPQAFEE